MTRPTLILLPGLLCDATVWIEQRRALARLADTHVVDFERRDSIERMAEHVLATAPAQTFALAGHSMGGRVAFEVQRIAPHRVERLALLDSGFSPLPQGAAADEERTKRLALLELAQREGMRAMGRPWARGMVHPRRIGTPLFEAILDMIERRDPDTFAAQIRALLGRPDAGTQLASIRCPTLLLVGRDDAWSPVRQHEEMAARIPGSSLVVIDDCAHMSTMEQPEAVSRALAAWLGEAPR